MNTKTGIGLIFAGVSIQVIGAVVTAANQFLLGNELLIMVTPIASVCGFLTYLTGKLFCLSTGYQPAKFAIAQSLKLDALSIASGVYPSLSVAGGALPGFQTNSGKLVALTLAISVLAGILATGFFLSFLKQSAEQTDSPRLAKSATSLFDWYIYLLIGSLGTLMMAFAIPRTALPEQIAPKLLMVMAGGLGVVALILTCRLLSVLTGLLASTTASTPVPGSDATVDDG